MQNLLLNLGPLLVLFNRDPLLARFTCEKCYTEKYQIVLRNFDKLRMSGYYHLSTGLKVHLFSCCSI